MISEMLRWTRRLFLSFFNSGRKPEISHHAGSAPVYPAAVRESKKVNKVSITTESTSGAEAAEPVKVIEKIRIIFGIPEEGVGIYFVASDGFLYYLGGESYSCYLRKFQLIRKGLTLNEALRWQQFIPTGWQARGTFRSYKKAYAALEVGEIVWEFSPYHEHNKIGEKLWQERSAHDFIPTWLNNSFIEKGKPPSVLGLDSWVAPWKTKKTEVVSLCT